VCAKSPSRTSLDVYLDPDIRSFAGVKLDLGEFDEVVAGPDTAERPLVKLVDLCPCAIPGVLDPESHST